MKSFFRSIRFQIVCCLLGGSAALASTTYYVNPDGDDSDGLTWGTAKQTIAGALTLATTVGDEVVITNGMYLPTATLNINQAITLRSHENDPETVLINGGSLGTVSMINMSADALISGLTFTNGNGGGTVNGAVTMSAGTVNNCVFVDNISRNRAGINMSGGRVIHSWFVNNTASGVASSSGGGIGVAGGGEIIACTFEGNHAQGSGGGINHNGAAALLISNCVFRSNTSNANGAGFYSDGNLTVVDSQFISNSVSAGRGAGLRLEGEGLVLRCDFIQNSISGSTQQGAGAYIVDSAIIDTCTFVSNSARNGGALYMESGTVRDSSFMFNAGWNGAAVYMLAGTLESSDVIGNTSASGVYYGAVYLGGEGVISNVTLIGNSVGDGGGIFMNAGLAVDCTIISNSAFRSHSSNQGAGGLYMTGGVADRMLIQHNDSMHVSSTGGARISGEGTVLRNSLIIGNEGHTRAGGVRLDDGGRIENCTVIGNRANAATYGGGITFEATGGEVINSIVLFNSSGGTHSNYYDGTTANFHHSLTMPLPAGAGNLATDPRFIDPGSGYGLDHIIGNYQLQQGLSPCINAGDSSLEWIDADARDFIGRPRLIHGGVDMGAYETFPRGMMIRFR